MNIRGLQSEIRYSVQADKTYRLVSIGKTLSVRLLDISDDSPKWDEIGRIELSANRDGFWQRTLREEKALDAYTMVGVFDQERESPFTFADDSVMAGQPMPLLWKDLPRTSKSLVSTPLLPFHHRRDD